MSEVNPNLIAEINAAKPDVLLPDLVEFTFSALQNGTPTYEPISEEQAVAFALAYHESWQLRETIVAEPMPGVRVTVGVRNGFRRYGGNFLFRCSMVEWPVNNGAVIHLESQRVEGLQIKMCFSTNVYQAVGSVWRCHFDNNCMPVEMPIWVSDPE